jgi:hypothetical protein
MMEKSIQGISITMIIKFPIMLLTRTILKEIVKNSPTRIINDPIIRRVALPLAFTDISLDQK